MRGPKSAVKHSNAISSRQKRSRWNKEIFALEKFTQREQTILRWISLSLSFNTPGRFDSYRTRLDVLRATSLSRRTSPARVFAIPSKIGVAPISLSTTTAYWPAREPLTYATGTLTFTAAKAIHWSAKTGNALIFQAFEGASGWVGRGFTKPAPVIVRSLIAGDTMHPRARRASRVNLVIALR